MNQLRQFHQQAIRAAIRIHEHLHDAARRANVDVLPNGRWDELGRVFQRFQLTQQRGWQAASDAVVMDLEYQLRRLMTELEVVRQSLPRQRSYHDPASVIAADLLALADEFEAVRIDLKQKVLRVDTAGIVLEDVDLGAFRIVLHWERIGSRRAYEARALDPNCPAGRSDVTHPHVEDHLLCEGAGATAINEALASGRLLDFFMLVRQILETYNGNSAYVPLSDWSGDPDVTCDDCGYEMSAEDRSYCDRCDCSICGDCSTHCEGCDHHFCSGCTGVCSGCSDAFCRSCLTEVAATERRLCRFCLQRKDQPHDEDHQRETPAADTVCLGEAAVPA
jgi:hypothetical protein